VIIDGSTYHRRRQVPPRTHLYVRIGSLLALSAIIPGMNAAPALEKQSAAIEYPAEGSCMRHGPNSAISLLLELSVRVCLGIALRLM